MISLSKFQIEMKRIELNPSEPIQYYYSIWLRNDLNRIGSNRIVGTDQTVRGTDGRTVCFELSGDQTNWSSLSWLLNQPSYSLVNFNFIPVKNFFLRNHLITFGSWVGISIGRLRFLINWARRPRAISRNLVVVSSSRNRWENKQQIFNKFLARF